MENQPPLPQNQTNGNLTNDSRDSQTIQQGLANTPYPQNTLPGVTVLPPNNVQPITPAPQAPPATIPGEIPPPPQGYGKNRRLVIVVGILALLLAALAGVSIFGRHSGHHANIGPNNSINTSNTPAARPATSATPLGETAYGSSDAAGLAISVARVIPNPPVTGDPPNTGTQYLEIDLSAVNSGKAATIIPGTFYYQTAAGSLLNTADTAGTKPDYPNKNVQVNDKESLTSLSLKPGRSDGGIIGYLIYQVPPADKGKLVWFQGYYDPTSTKLAIFNLY